MMATIRPLTLGDVRAFADIRAEAVRMPPETFGSPEEEQGGAARDRLYIEWLARSFGCLSTPTGSSAQSNIMRPQTNAHPIADLCFTALVPQSPRRNGVGSALIKSILEGAKPFAEDIRLRVVASAHEAVSAYLPAGFQIYGADRRPVRRKGIDYDEHLMLRLLTSSHNEEP